MGTLLASLVRVFCSGAETPSVLPPSRAARPSCVFCRIAGGKERPGGKANTLQYEDHNLMAFSDRSPAAAKHILVCPKAHVGTVSDLRRGEQDHALVVDMLAVGRSLLEKDAAPGAHMQYKYGFHVPPFNSVDHLHLHCLTLPFSPTWKSLKYTESMLGSWLPADKCLERLRPENGGGGGDGGARASPRARAGGDGGKSGSAHQ